MSDCLFCKIARKEIASKIIYEDRQVVAFEDINPQAPVHTLIISKPHFETLNDVGAEQEGRGLSGLCRSPLLSGRRRSR